MAKQEKKEPLDMVQCAYCGKRISASEARSYMDVAKDKEPSYFCSPEHAIAKLFGIVRQFDEFMLGIENAR